MTGYVRPLVQLGYLSPLPVVDAMHYEFYQAIPAGMVLVASPVAIEAFDAPSAEAALGRAGDAMRYLKGRGVDRIIFGGLPVSALAGRPRMLQLMQQAQETLGIPVSSDFEDTVEALQHLGARRVAVAAKWRTSVLDAVADYLSHAGIEVAGCHGSDFGAREVMHVNTVGSDALAVELGRAAWHRFPDAQALVLGGGTWLGIPATVALEAEFGRPVVSNMVSSFWNAARHAAVPFAQGLGCRLLS